MVEAATGRDHRSMNRSRALVALSTVVPTLLASVLLTGCDPFEEHMCSEGEYPTWRPDGPGAACFADGTEPKPGYVAYPEGDVPDLLADEYAPLERYPELAPWAKKYVTWQKAGAQGDPPLMPDVVD